MIFVHCSSLYTGLPTSVPKMMVPSEACFVPPGAEAENPVLVDICWALPMCVCVCCWHHFMYDRLHVLLFLSMPSTYCMRHAVASFLNLHTYQELSIGLPNSWFLIPWAIIIAPLKHTNLGYNDFEDTQVRIIHFLAPCCFIFRTYRGLVLPSSPPSSTSILQPARDNCMHTCV